MKRSNILTSESATVTFDDAHQGTVTLLPNDGKLHRLLLSWDAINLQQMTIHIPANQQVDIVELGEPNQVKIIYHIGAFSKVSLVRASLQKVVSNQYIFEVEEGARIDAGLADFAHGKKKEQVTFNLRGRDSHVSWRLSSFADQNDDKEFDISFIHYAPSTYASMANYGVVADTSRLVFSGVSHICTALSPVRPIKMLK